MVINSSHLKDILDKYTEACSYRGKQKVDYQSWRTMVKLTNIPNEYEVNFVQKPGLDVPALQFVTSDGFASHVVINKDFMQFLQERVDIKMTTRNNSIMNMNFDFGPISDGVAISPYGLAIRAADGKWLTYNPANHQTVDVTGFIFNFKGMIYKMPVAISAIAVGDLIVHQRKPMYVTDVTDNNIEVVDILSSEAKKIIPVTNMFGFNFITKITSIINLGTTTPSPEQPFGNIMPMIMADMVFGGNDEDSAFGNMDMSKLAMISMMTGNSNPFGSLFNFGGIAGSAPTGDSK